MGQWDAAIAQVVPATIVKIDLENGYTYYNDETDYAKLATNPEHTRPAPALNFRTRV